MSRDFFATRISPVNEKFYFPRARAVGETGRNCVAQLVMSTPSPSTRLRSHTIPTCEFIPYFNCCPSFQRSPVDSSMGLDFTSPSTTSVSPGMPNISPGMPSWRRASSATGFVHRTSRPVTLHARSRSGSAAPTFDLTSMTRELGHVGPYHGLGVYLEATPEAVTAAALGTSPPLVHKRLRSETGKVCDFNLMLQSSRDHPTTDDSGWAGKPSGRRPVSASLARDRARLRRPRPLSAGSRSTTSDPGSSLSSSRPSSTDSGPSCELLNARSLPLSTWCGCQAPLCCQFLFFLRTCPQVPCSLLTTRCG